MLVSGNGVWSKRHVLSKFSSPNSMTIRFRIIPLVTAEACRARGNGAVLEDVMVVMVVVVRKRSSDEGRSAG
jgi:hypothetical protein